MAKIKSYTEAAEELESILRSLEGSDDLNMDVLEKQMKRAAELLTYCKGRLRRLDEELDKITRQIDGAEA